MKGGIKKVVFSLFYKLGFYAPKRINSPEKTYLQLIRQPMSDQAFELKRISSFMAVIDNHQYYNKLLHHFVPEWTIILKQFKFVGKGIGANSLNTFRRCELNGETLFEKVYFNFAMDLERAVWFQENVKAFLNQRIIIPEILKIYRGDLITISYSDYLELIPEEDRIADLLQLELANILITQSLRHQKELELLEIPEFIKNFREHFEYRRNIDAARQVFKQETLSIDYFENLLGKSLKVITHGDIQKTNIFKNKVLVDWDAFGVFPLGLDIAFIYFRRVLENSKYTNPLEWLTLNNLNFHKSEFEIDLKRNFCYFSFIFLLRFFKSNEHQEIMDELILELKKYNE